MSADRGEVSITALLTAVVLLIVVQASTLGMLDGVSKVTADASRRVASQEAARSATDRIARDLRNLASPTLEQPEAVDKAAPQDLVFKTVDPAGPNAGTNATNTKRVRYCLDAVGQLHEQTQTWTTELPPAVPPTASCPAPGWTRSEVTAAGVVNATLPIFTYSSAVLTDISSVHLELLVDSDATKDPPATLLSTGVFLRNQNRKPVGAFTATKVVGGIVLNGSASSDPEGEPLTYKWYDGTTLVGTGITFTYAVPAGTSHTLRVDVFDPAGLIGVSPTQVVVA